MAFLPQPDLRLWDELGPDLVEVEADASLDRRNDLVGLYATLKQRIPNGLSWLPWIGALPLGIDLFEIVPAIGACRGSDRPNFCLFSSLSLLFLWESILIAVC